MGRQRIGGALGGDGGGVGGTSDIAKRGLVELRSSMRPLRSCSMNSITMNTSSSFLPTTTCTAAHKYIAILLCCHTCAKRMNASSRFLAHRHL